MPQIIRLLAQTAIYDNGDGAVVVQSHIHIGTENTAPDCYTAISLQLTTIGIIQRHCFITMHGACIPGTIAATCRGRQRKLAHGYNSALDIADTTIHHSGVIIEDT